jgi:alpha-galactosidase
MKELADGNRAFGIFNLGTETLIWSLDLPKVGFTGSVSLRDLWRQKNLGSFSGFFETRIPSHGVVLVKTM